MTKNNSEFVKNFIKKTKLSISEEDISEAFVHRSFLNESKSSKLENNERLEFLGDAVLELVATEFLFEKYPKKPEGELTALRSALVRGKNLSQVAENLDIFGCLLLSKGESRTTGKARGLILANTIEAIIGAIYKYSGYEEAKRFIDENILSIIDNIIEDKLYVDAKSDFQEKVQERDKKTPYYKVEEEEGPDHNKVFVSGVYIGKKLVATGQGNSKSQAEQEAAISALNKEFKKA